jgi:hypothetical protein
VGREHLWFEVHDVKNDHLDATLVNDPFDISSMKVGDRRHHAAELVTDWAIMTPLGQLTPRSLELARKLRELRPKILEFPPQTGVIRALLLFSLIQALTLLN